ncbi:hypothetical protein ACIQNI_32130 [Streptomyces sp. NPDC091266]|uniref:hypothetical protein n=1 Tax=Streptomyces sp. NPDC091266 TaxID=3365978 RepID=UPI0037F54135
MTSTPLDPHFTWRFSDPASWAVNHPALELFAPGSLVVSIGPAASGESRFASAFPGDLVVCLDELRERLAGDFSVKSSVLRTADRSL